MTNFLTDFMGRIVSYYSHCAVRLYARMVQWLRSKKSLLLSHVYQCDVGSTPGEASIFGFTWGNSLVLVSEAVASTAGTSPLFCNGNSVCGVLLT